LVRRHVRDVVRDSGGPPRLTLWASVGGNCRKARAFPVGAAESSVEVRSNIREGILEQGSMFAAVVTQLRVIRGVHTPPIHELGLVVAVHEADGQVLVERWEVDVQESGLGPWREGVFEDSSLGALMGMALRDVVVRS
jgi:hypothetical protein